MQVKVYGYGWMDLGAVQYEITWDTVRPEALGKEDIDPDADIIGNVEYRATKDEAMRRAQEIFDAAIAEPMNLAWGSVDVRKQVVALFDGDDYANLAEWRDDESDFDSITDPTDYQTYREICAGR